MVYLFETETDDKENSVDKLDDGTVEFSKLSWYIPHVSLIDETKLSLMRHST